MNDSKLIELAERVEALDGPDREVDAEVFLTQWPGYKIQTHNDRFPEQVQPGRIQEPDGIGWLQSPAYTASLDAAMTLVPEGWCWTVARYWSHGEPLEPPRYFADVGDLPAICKGGDGTIIEVIAATPALALVAACLKALAGDRP